MTKHLVYTVFAIALLGLTSAAALAGTSAADISGGNMTHGCSPVTNPCK